MFNSLDDSLENTADGSAPTRRFRRWHVDFEARLAIGVERLKCTVHDVSPGGACVELLGGGALAVGARLDFELPGYGSIPAEIRYDRDGYQGLMFLHREAGELAVARYLVAIDQNQRGAERYEVNIAATLLAGGTETTCFATDISRTGARLAVADTRHVNPGQHSAKH